MDVSKWSDADYEEALSLYEDPSGLPEETVRKLGQQITLFETSRGSRAADQYRPVGPDVLEQDENFQQWHESGKDFAKRHEKRGVVRKFAGGETAARFDELDALTDQPDVDEIERAVAQGKLDKASSDLPSGSKVAEIFRPPEFMPKGADVLTAVLAARHFEPTVDQFRAEMRDVLRPLGVDVNTLDEASPEFQEYADLKWQQVYDLHEREGKPVVRDAYKKDESWIRKADTLIDRGVDKARAAGYGLVAGLLPGAEKLFLPSPSDAPGFGRQPEGLFPTTDLSDPSLAAERNPGTEMAGTIAGAISPASAGSRVAGGIYRGVAGAGASLGRRALASGAAGLGAGAAEAALSTGGSVLAGETIDPEFEAKKALLAASLGGVMGGAGDLLASGAGAIARRTRRGSLGEKVRLAEAAGFETSPIERMKPSPALQADIDAAEKAGALHPSAALADDIAKKGAQTLRDAQIASRREAERTTEGYYRATDADPEAARGPQELLERTVDALRNRRTEQGDVPFESSKALVNELRKMARGSIVPKGTGSMDEHEITLSFEELQEMGIGKRALRGMLDEDSKRMLPESGEGLDPDLFGDDGGLENFEVVLTGVKMSPRQFDITTRALDRAAGAVEGSTGRKDPVYDELMQAAHADREQFPPHRDFAPESLAFEREGASGEKHVVTGWAARKAENERLLRETGDLAESTGFPRELPSRTPRPLGGGPPEEPLENVPSVLPKPSREQEAAWTAEARAARPGKVGFLETNAVKMFTRGYDDTIRRLQRGEPPDEIAKSVRPQPGESPQEHVRKAQVAIQGLKRFFEKTPPTTSIPYVYRGMSLDEEGAQRFLQGDEFDLGGMVTSASWDPIVGRSFAARGDGEHQVVLKLAHKSGRAIPDLSSPKNLGSEKELLLPGDARFKVLKRYRDPQNPNHVVVEAEEITDAAAHSAKLAERTLPGLSPKEWEGVQNTILALNSPQKNQALMAWKRLANMGQFSDDLDRVRGLAAGEGLRHGGASGPRLTVGQGLIPSLYMSAGEGIRLRTDPAVRALAARPADLGDDLTRLLRMMRRRPTKESVTLGQQVFGLAGGQLGARAGAVAASEDQLTEEDLQNLTRLLEARDVR